MLTKAVAAIGTATVIMLKMAKFWCGFFVWIFFAGICVLEVFCCIIYFTATLPLARRKQSLSRQVKECVLLLQRMATGSGISKVMLLILALDVSSQFFLIFSLCAFIFDPVLAFLCRRHAIRCAVFTPRSSCLVQVAALERCVLTWLKQLEQV
jgi:hypothetical protein